MRIVTADQAATVVSSGDTVVIGGSGAGHAVPDELIAAVARRFHATGEPRNLTSLHPVGLGDRGERGLSHWAHEGLLKRVVCGTLVDSPKVAEMVAANAIEAWTLPQGALSQLMREMAAGRPGLVTHVGLHTLVDPRHGGGRQTSLATEDLVELVQLGGREWLFYKALPIHVCFIRGTTADEDGNLTMEQEAVFGEMLSMAQATRTAGGVVVAQVKRIASRGTLPPKHVKVPGMLVDLVVVVPDQPQTYFTPYSAAYAGELRIPLSDIPALPLDPRKVIARRAALELYPGAVCNLGSGVSTGVASVAAEEGFLDDVVLTNEQGLIGGAPASGNEPGAARNYMAIVDQPYQFDFYDGGGIDLAFLSFAQVDRHGNVNVSRFGGRIIGIGGFVNISQNAKKVMFSGTLTAGGLAIDWPDGTTRITREGRELKFVDAVEQLSYSGAYGRARGQETLFITERAVFRRDDAGTGGLELIEIAPGVDVRRDVIERMAFAPRVAESLETMDARIFRPQPMGLAAEIRGRPRRLTSPRLAAFDRKDPA
jgi:propionate CoA-transferase